jgi:hypothetical protein
MTMTTTTDALCCHYRITAGMGWDG